MPEKIGEAPAKAQLTDPQRELRLWKSALRMHLRDGSILTVLKVMTVTRYCVALMAQEYAVAQMVPKHAVDRVEMRPPPGAGEISAI